MVESTIAGIMITFMYPMNWALAFAAGSMMSAVSPAVVVPACIRLQNAGYGTDKGINGIIMAAASLDDILAISKFGIFLGFGLGGEGGHNTFGDDPMVNSIIHGPFEIIAGIILGFIIGQFLKTDCFTNIPYKYKAPIILCTALGLTFAWDQIGMAGLGYLASITMASIGATKWGKHEAEEVEGLISYVWLVIQVPLFGLIGSAVYFADLDWADVGIAIIIILASLVTRFPSAMYSMVGANCNFKEKMFVAIAWMPKATVQAALGGVVLGLANDNDLGDEMVLAGERIIILAFFSIVLTAPLGAILTAFFGTKLLTLGDKPEE